MFFHPITFSYFCGYKEPSLRSSSAPRGVHPPPNRVPIPRGLYCLYLRCARQQSVALSRIPPEMGLFCICVLFGLVIFFCYYVGMGGVQIHKIKNIQKEKMVGNCAHCGVVKLVLNTNGTYRCILKANQSKTRRLLKVEVNDIREIFNKQDGRCAICKKELHGAQRGYVDHDHKTMVVRGLLCNRCNLGIGMFFDDISILKSAISYLGHI